MEQKKAPTCRVVKMNDELCGVQEQGAHREGPGPAARRRQVEAAGAARAGAAGRAEREAPAAPGPCALSWHR